MNARNPADRPIVTESNAPFALCVNGVPIARVPYESAIDHAAATLEQIRRTVRRASGEFSVGLCRLESRTMDELPAACPSLLVDAVVRVIRQLAEGESR